MTKKKSLTFNEVDQMEKAEKKIGDLEKKLLKTREIIEAISAVPKCVKIASVRMGSITFKVLNEGSFKPLVMDIIRKFKVSFDKDFSETNGMYLLQCKVDGVKIKITHIPAPKGCDVKVERKEEMVKRVRYLPFGECEAILK